jgi:ABC-2 type transport system permease protein
VTSATYVRIEVLRTLRNRRFLVFSLVFPLVLYFAIALPNKHGVVDAIALRTYFMCGMMAWGAMTAVISSGARIAQERSVGWTRQMRITPLRTRVYFRAKVLCGYMMAAFSIAALSLAGTSVGVRLSGGQWATMVGLVLIGLVPFAVIGIVLGHLLRVDSLGPALGGITSLFALLGGAFGPLITSGVLLNVVKAIPSYWLVQAADSALGSGGWPPAESWIVLAAWTVVLTWIATRVYQRDTARV